MKKKNAYTEKVVLHPSGAIAGAGCGCPAGVDGRCNHLAATLLQLKLNGIVSLVIQIVL